MAIREEKVRLIEQTREKLSKFFADRSQAFANDVARIVGEGTFTVKELQQRLKQLGYDDAIIAGLGQFQTLLDLSRQQFAASGYSFIFTEQNEVAFRAMMNVKTTSLARGGLKKFANDLVDYAIQAKLSQKPSKQIIDEMTERYAAEGRRIGTEVDTALSLFDRTTESMLYDNNNVERFIYWGPIDAENRPTCRRALESRFQETGWTLQNIRSFPGIDRYQGGYPYYNCRHKFLAWTPEIDNMIDREIEELQNA